MQFGEVNPFHVPAVAAGNDPTTSPRDREMLPTLGRMLHAWRRHLERTGFPVPMLRLMLLLLLLTAPACSAGLAETVDAAASAAAAALAVRRAAMIATVAPVVLQMPVAVSGRLQHGYGDERPAWSSAPAWLRRI